MSENGPGGTPPDENEPTQPPAGAVPPAGAYPPPPGSVPPPPAGSVPPPPAGAYPPPPAGAYPPPAGGYPPPGAVPPGAMPPAPQPYGYAGGAQPVSVGEAFNYGWTKFTANVGPILLAALAYVVAIAIVSGIWSAILSAIGVGYSGKSTIDAYGNVTPGASAGLFGIFFASAVFGLVFIALIYVMQAGIIRGALHITYGRPLELKTFFQFDGVGTVVLAALLMSVLSSVLGGITCGLGSLVVSFFGQFTLLFVVDKRQGAIEALKSSFALVNKNVGTVIALFLASLLAYLIGAALCGIGLLVAIPVMVIATTFMYRRLLGEPVAP